MINFDDPTSNSEKPVPHNPFDELLGRRYATIKDLCPHIEEVRIIAAQYLKELLAGKPESRFEILEPGCGSGSETLLLLKADPRVNIIGIDSANTMLEQVATDPRLTLVQSDVQKYLAELPEQCFDGVASALFTHNLTPPERDAYYQALGRVIKPGGVYVNLDICVPDDKADHQRRIDEQLVNVGAIESFDLEAGRAWRDHMLHDAADDMRFTWEEQSGQLDANGFDGKRVLDKRLESIFTAVKRNEQ